MNWIFLAIPIDVPMTSVSIGDKAKFWKAIVSELSSNGNDFAWVLGKGGILGGKRVVTDSAEISFAEISSNEVDVLVRFEYHYETSRSDAIPGTLHKVSWNCKIDPMNKKLIAATLLW